MKYLVLFFACCASLEGTAYHNFLWKASQGDVIQLEDSSRWSLKPSDRYKICAWQPSDQLMITPNYVWFSTYLYRLTNLNTNEVVEVKLAARPDSKDYLWIKSFDIETQQITLSDASTWVLIEPSSLQEDWVIDDPILVGHNKGFFSATFPHILINLETITHVKAREL
jgi:hypothetical protein